MKKINWVVDKYLFDEYEEQLTHAIELSGAVVHFYDDLCGKPFKEWITEKFTEKDIVIFHGSLQHGKQLSHLPIYPGTFMTIDNYECYKYYGYYGDNLLNSKYMMMGLNDVVRRKQEIQFQLVPARGYPYRLDNTFFIRPSNGYKSFAGQLMVWGKIEEEINVLLQSYGGVEPDTLVLLSNTQKIEEEYRFIVIDGKVISGSTYFDSENIGTFKPHYDKICTDVKAIDFADQMVKLYQPDKAFTIDVCKRDDGEYKLLEINSFNCASMYGNSHLRVVNAINKLALKEYNDLFEI